METAYLLFLLLALSIVDMRVSVLSLSNTTQATTPNTIKHTATTPNTMKHTATTPNTIKHTATTPNTIKHTATTPNTMKHTATTRNTIKHTATTRNTIKHTDITPNTMKHTATTPNTIKHTATTPNTIKHTGETSITPTTGETSITPTTERNHQTSKTPATERTNASNISERSPQTSKTPGETSITPTTGETLVTPTTERSRQTSKTTVQPIVSENTRKPYIIDIDLDQTKAELKLSVSVPFNFDEDLRKKTSKHYIRLEYEFKEQLTEVFTLIPGFLSIDILQLVNVSGRVVADLRVNFIPNLTVMHDAIKFIENNASMLLHSVNISGQHPKILQGNSSYSYQLKDGSMGSLCPFLAPTTCPFGYICQQASSGRVYCEDKCSLNRTFCHNDGECFVDHRNDKLKCRCLDTNSDYYFSGENCEFIKPKGNSSPSPSSLSVKDYAIIGGIAAAAIIVILVIFLGVRALRKSFVNSMDKDIGNDDESFSSNISVTHVSVHMSHMDVSNPHERQGIDNTAEVFHSGLPQVTTNDLKLYRDSQANRDSQAKHEAFVYQPSNLAGPLSSSTREFDSPEIDRKLEQNGKKNTSSNKNSKKYIL